ncbi:hypothetical protein DUI87_04224 [Hirundo rustica rustica]|uniref:Uncharacterized protein n=1 Tax=Hirundo rustica rustica TaxID=333673 RepID=A0A3M0KYK9_HIRRU|nr:hypothetical protein DUI87_04224 [Hirundo rustica rustica]
MKLGEKSTQWSQLWENELHTRKAANSECITLQEMSVFPNMLTLLKLKDLYPLFLLSEPSAVYLTQTWLQLAWTHLVQEQPSLLVTHSFPPTRVTTNPGLTPLHTFGKLSLSH